MWDKTWQGLIKDLDKKEITNVACHVAASVGRFSGRSNEYLSSLKLKAYS